MNLKTPKKNWKLSDRLTHDAFHRNRTCDDFVYNSVFFLGIFSCFFDYHLPVQLVILQRELNNDQAI